MLETIYITRHGFRSNWENTKWSPSPTGIDADPALASHGVEQAIELATYLKALDANIQKIYTSPFYRCIQTIDHTANALDLSIHVDNGIGEWYGITRATHPSPATINVLKNFFPRIEENYQPSVVPSNKGETMAEIHERVRKAMEIIIRDAEKSDCSAILLCTHAATNDVR
ncbi:protein of unknown function [Taphrina deformans PYCC 5710]|uniref:Phosphoglycerate mutase family protein n=1 Tax=Taphrina deformans (strain PYCC 5710 / ATCC 11124 / CBS 356.35 / IMI 108563 / JCM 9778 / NBRC 8474) TaxID=1097556 RepID=R4XEZ0_TAPDE|nr:protein of unknown function [Taphrina deformans PYCC 5710]|eukprot:CCG84432.1 protein of unknown function [Taphrina deformans PYCC 5710]